MYYVIYLTKENEIEIETRGTLASAMTRYTQLRHRVACGVVVDEKELARGCNTIEQIKAENDADREYEQEIEDYARYLIGQLIG